MRIKFSLRPKLMIAVIVSIMLLSTVKPAMAELDSWGRYIDKVNSYYQRQTNLSEWEALAVRWTGLAVGSKMMSSAPATPSDFARVIMGSISAGEEEARVTTLINELEDMQQVDGYFGAEGTAPTLNQTVWALIALDFAEVNGYVTSFNREAAASYIVSQQDSGGGFDESGYGVDVDSTAHVLISLAPYQDTYSAAVQSALDYLKSQQFDNGGFGGWGTCNPDTTAAVIEALIALGIDPLASQWIPGEQDMVQALLEFQSEEGWFVYSQEVSDWNDPTLPNAVSTRNALLALGDLQAGVSKYHTMLPDHNGLTLTVQSAQLTAERDAEVNISLEYHGYADRSVLMISGLFDEDTNRMTGYQAVATDLSPGSSWIMKHYFNIPAGNYCVRIFVWNGWEENQALLPAVTIPIEE